MGLATQKNMEQHVSKVTRLICYGSGILSSYAKECIGPVLIQTKLAQH